MNQEDKILVLRWQQGDSGAAACVVKRYNAALGAVAYGILRDASLSEDVVQETFIRATRQLHTLDGVHTLGGWLMGIARHVALDMRRKRRREVPLTHDIRQTNSHPGREAGRAELREHLRSAVEALPQDQRDLYAMKYVADMSYRDIGRALDMTPAAVGQKLWRVRQKLQRALKRFYP